MKIKLLIQAFSLIALAVVLSCGGESPVIKLGDVIEPCTSCGGVGDNIPSLVAVYPENLSTDIPVDTDIVLVFSEPVNLLTINTTNVSITGVTAFTASAVTDGRTVIIDITTPGTLLNNTLYTIQVTMGVTDSGGTPLDSVYNSTFTTVVDNSIQADPYVIAATRYPGPVGGVSVNQPYVEVTFTKDMTPGTITTSSFNINPAVGASITPVNAKTYRLNLNTMAYNTLYTVDLDNTITDSEALPNTLVQDGNDTWQFTTEADPDTVGALAYGSIWVESVTTNSAWICFLTNKPDNRNNFVVDYDIDSGAPYASTSAVETDWDGDSKNNHTLHKIQLTGISSSTLYYFRARETALPLNSTEYTFITHANAGSPSDPVTTAANDQDGIKVVQNNNGSSYAFWESHDADDNIYGQFFATSGVLQWGANAVCTAGSDQTSIMILNNRFTDALVLYKTGTTSVFGKMIYNNGGNIGFRWPGQGSTAAGDGLLNISISAGSNYSAALVHERPIRVTYGTADMPANGTPANLLYDQDVDFSLLAGLNDGDYLLWGGGPWNLDTIFSVDSWGIFRYVIRNTGATDLDATTYYIADQVATVPAGAVDSLVSATEFDADDANLSSVIVGDVINCNGTWGYVVNSTFQAGTTYRIQTSIIHGLAVSDPYAIYPRIAGPSTSEAVTNPLWDGNPNDLFTVISVAAGDFIVNENNNTAAGTYANVVTIENDYTLTLDEDIMNNGDNYSIVRLPSGAAVVAAGYSNSVPANFNLDDSNALFLSGKVGVNPMVAVAQGDVVYNIDRSISAEVVTINSETQLTLSADIFNAANDKYIIYRKRAFMVVYVDGSSDIIGNVFNIADGAAIGIAIPIAAGTFKNPVSVSDEAGNAIVFYEDATDIHAKSISASGATNWTRGSILSGYTIVQVLKDNAPYNGTTTYGQSGAYLVAKNATNNIQIVRINGYDGTTITGWPVSITGYNPNAIVDSIAGSANRLIITYMALNTNYYIRIRAYNSNGTVAFGPTDVTSSTATYNCYIPRIALGDPNTGASAFSVAWLDQRYYSTSGYAIFAQRFSSAGAAQWTPSGVFISSPTSYGYDYPIGLELLYWNTADPFGLLPIWPDYYNYATTGYDIYYEIVSSLGAY